MSRGQNLVFKVYSFDFRPSPIVFRPDDCGQHANALSFSNCLAKGSLHHDCGQHTDSLSFSNLLVPGCLNVLTFFNQCVNGLTFFGQGAYYSAAAPRKLQWPTAAHKERIPHHLAHLRIGFGSRSGIVLSRVAPRATPSPGNS